ncbi:hypothetical protein AMS59_12925 [Lysinibacillus sp. FJAT-14745]|nr:hypothetical protein AMS59_12925 [Lysinibacillus sp. FJAT-14745]
MDSLLHCYIASRRCQEVSDDATVFLVWYGDREIEVIRIRLNGNSMRAIGKYVKQYFGSNDELFEKILFNIP